MIKINVRPFFFALAGIVAACTLTSCAKEKDFSTEDIQQELLEAYIHVKYGASKPTKAALGYYYIPLKEVGEGGQKPIEGNWVKYDVVVYAKDGTIINTSLESVVRELGIFSYSKGFHYIPDYQYYSKAYAALAPVLDDAIRNLMHVGDSIRLITVPTLATGLLGIGNIVDVSPTIYNDPIIVDIVLRQVIEDPILDERAQLIAFRDKYFPQIQDSLKQDFFFIELEPAIDTVVVKSGYTVRYLYSGKFLDGFLFDSSITDTIKAHYSYLTIPTTDTVSYTIGSGGLISGFEEILLNMKAGSRAVGFFSSTPWGYGYAGKNNGDRKIQPFTPLLFEIKLVDVTTNESTSAE